MRTSVYMITLALGFLIASAATAGTGGYVLQNSFNLPPAIIGAMDADSVGNLYILGKANGTATYSISSFQTQGIAPLLSFDTSSTNPLVFGVEAAGNTDLLVYDPATGVFYLKRFGNTGGLLGQTVIPYTITRYFAFSVALDKINKLVYITKFWRIQPCLDVISGCTTAPPGTPGLIYQYDFLGNLLKTITTSGDAYLGTGCYEPRSLTVDSQGNLFVGDSTCHHLLEYSMSGTLVSDSGLIPDFSPGPLWTDLNSDVYSSQLICNPTGSTYCLPGIAKYSPTGSMLTSFWTPAPGPYLITDGGLAWNDRILYLSSQGGEPLQRFIFDNPPSIPNESSPIGGLSEHVPTVNFSWQQSSDPDSDAISYGVYTGTDPNQLVFIGSTTDTSLAGSNFSFGATYYWQVTAQDYYLGLPVSVSSAPIVSLVLNFLNHPPGPFSVLGGTGTVLTRTSDVTLSWQASVDPDGDPVSYGVAISTNSNFLAFVASTTATNFDLGVQFGTTYYWQVMAQDPYGASAQTAIVPLLAQFDDHGPVAVSTGSSLPSGWITSVQASVNMVWPVYADPDGDPVTYQIFLGNSGQAPGYSGSANSYTLSGLAFNTPYNYLIQATDNQGKAVTVASDTFTLVSEAPPAQAYNYPNPFRVSQGTNFVYVAGSALDHLKISVYTAFQDLVWRTEVGPLAPGVSQVHWDGRDSSGREVFSGMYFVVFDSSEGRQIARFVGVR